MVRSILITEDRIRELAYRLWLEDGQPQGRSGKHWKKARELLVLEANSGEGEEGVAEGYNPPMSWGGTAEGVRMQENQGGFPTMTDRGEQKTPKTRRPSMARKPAKRRPT